MILRILLLFLLFMLVSVIFSSLIFYPIFILMIFLKKTVFKSLKISQAPYSETSEKYFKPNMILLLISIIVNLYIFFQYGWLSYKDAVAIFILGDLPFISFMLVYLILSKKFILPKSKYLTSPNFHYFVSIGLILISLSFFYIRSAAFINNWIERNRPCDVSYLQQVGEADYNRYCLKECQKNGFCIVKALELYGEKNNHYPSSLKELQPKYIKSIPTCPAGDSQYNYSVNAYKNTYTLFCIGSNHTDAGFPKDYPLFTGKIKKKNTESKK